MRAAALHRAARPCGGRTTRPQPRSSSSLLLPTLPAALPPTHPQVAPANSLAYYDGAQEDAVRVHVVALAGGRAVAAIGGMDTDNLGVRFLSYEDRPAPE